MSEVSNRQNTTQEQVRAMVVRRIEPVIANFLHNDDLFDELDLKEMVARFAELMMKKFSPAEFDAMSEEELLQRTRRFLGVEVMSGLISDFTPEEMAEFDAAVLGQQWRLVIY